MLHSLTIIFLSLIIGTVEAVVLSSNANESLSEWLNCHPAIPLNVRVERQCPNCEINQSQDRTSVSNISDDVRRSCLPPAEQGQALFSNFVQPAIMVQRDSYICQCLQNGNGGEIENNAFNSGDGSDARVEFLRNTSEAKYTQLYQNELTERYSTDRLQTAVTTLSYVDNAQDSINLTTPYSILVAGDQVTSAVTAAAALSVSSTQSVAQQHLHRQEQYAEVANNEQLERPILQAGRVARDSNICVPYRHFIAHNMFPEDADFYDNLNSAEIWNYRTLMEELSSMEKNAGSRGEVLNRPRGKRIFSRIKFLYDNPVLKNILLSDNETVRNQLVEIIRTIPRPNCSTGPCTRDENWKRLMPEFERKMAGFLASEGAINASRQGAVISSQLGYEVSEGRARQISLASQSIIPEGLLNAAEWKGYCKALDQLKNRGRGIASYVGDIEKELGVRNFGTPEADPDFQNLNDQLCSKRRRNPQTNTVETLNNFLLTACRSSTTGRCAPEKRGALIAEYLDTYREPVDQVDERLIADIAPFLEGEVGGPRDLSSRDLKELSVASRDPARVSGPVRFTSQEYAALTPANAASGNTASTSTNTPVSRSPANSVQQRSSEQVESAVFSGQNDRAFGSSLAVPNVSTSEPRPPELLRSALAESESEIQELRNQKDETIRELAAAPRGAAFQSLTTRLEELEQRLRREEIKNQELRAEIAEANADSEEESSRPQRNNSQVAANESRRSSGSGQSNTAAAAPQAQGGVSGGSAFAPSSIGGQASLGRSTSGSSAAPTRAGGAGSNSVNNSKYENSGQGAIIVSATSNPEEYQSLRSRSENSIITDEVSAVEFEQIAGNNQEALNRYLERVRAMPGEVVRLNLTAGSERSMELFVVKDGDLISIVQGQGIARGIAAQGAAEPVGQPRDATLDDLRRNIQVEAR